MSQSGPELAQNDGAAPTAQRPSKIDLPTNNIGAGQDAHHGEEERPSTPEFTVAEDDHGNYRVLWEGKGPEYEQEKRRKKPQRTDGKVELSTQMAWEKTGFAFPQWKKWMILCVVFMVQVSMNFNTSVYPSAVSLIPEDPRYEGVSEQGARVGQMIFLVAYAFGSEVCFSIEHKFVRILTLL